MGAIGRMAVVLAAASAPGVPTTSTNVPPTAFGGTVGVRIAHVGHIEIDRDSPSGNDLLRVACARPNLPGRACYVAR